MEQQEELVIHQQDGHGFHNIVKDHLQLLLLLLVIVIQLVLNVTFKQIVVGVQVQIVVNVELRVDQSNQLVIYQIGCGLLTIVLLLLAPVSVIVSFVLNNHLVDGVETMVLNLVVQEVLLDLLMLFVQVLNGLGFLGIVLFQHLLLLHLQLQDQLLLQLSTIALHTLVVELVPQQEDVDIVLHQTVAKQELHLNRVFLLVMELIGLQIQISIVQQSAIVRL